MTEESLIGAGWRSSVPSNTAAFLLFSGPEEMNPMEPFQSLPISTSIGIGTFLPPSTNIGATNNLCSSTQLNMTVFAFISRNEGGNYITYSRYVPTSTWYRCLENSISPIPEDQVLNAMRVATIIFYGASIERRFVHDYMPLPYSVVKSIMSKPKALDVPGAPILQALRVEQNHAEIIAQEAARAAQLAQQQAQSTQQGPTNARRLPKRARFETSSTPLNVSTTSASGSNGQQAEVPKISLVQQILSQSRLAKSRAQAQNANQQPQTQPQTPAKRERALPRSIFRQ